MKVKSGKKERKKIQVKGTMKEEKRREEASETRSEREEKAKQEKGYK